MDLKGSLFVFCVVFAVIVVVEGQLRCYTCGFSSIDTDRSCLTITNSTPTVNCRFTFCTIMRQEYLDPPGQISSFVRGCDQTPDFLNHEIVDSTFRTFYRACTNDFCNIGDGVQSVVGGNLSPRPQFEGKNLLVRGTGVGDASSVKLNMFVIILIAFLYSLA